MKHKPIHLVSVIGTRPQCIKLAAISRALETVEGFRHTIVDTGQHYDAQLSKIFFDELKMPKPHFNLNIGSLPQGAQTGRMLEAIERVLTDIKPDVVLVFGDTNSTLAASLAAVKMHFKLAHVEAGLRSFNRRQPEEINRIVSDHCADMLFTPTDGATLFLKNEGVSPDKIIQCGDVMYDNILYYGQWAQKQSSILDQLNLKSGDYILSTVHRAENTDERERLKNIFEALDVLSQSFTVVLPLHPRTKNFMAECGWALPQRVSFKIIEPVGYLDMLQLEKSARLVVSDSGGVPKEAFFFGVPSVILRRDVIWDELKDLGWVDNVEPLAVDMILETVQRSLNRRGVAQVFPYGNGTAAQQILSHIKGQFS